LGALLRPRGRAGQGAGCGPGGPPYKFSPDLRRGLDVNQHIGNPIERLQDVQPRLVGDLVGLPHGHVRVDFQVQVDVVAETGLAGVALLHARTPSTCEAAKRILSIRRSSGMVSINCMAV